ncbi:hypothetical protein LEP1GSC163_3515 [Leptospira santarosai str. CBC379]|nr:hypothetical protein LEP1GSC163_3515 [Leptospira santarosai str. CBC379]
MVSLKIDFRIFEKEVRREEVESAKRRIPSALETSFVTVTPPIKEDRYIFSLSMTMSRCPSLNFIFLIKSRSQNYLLKKLKTIIVLAR